MMRQNNLKISTRTGYDRTVSLGLLFAARAVGAGGEWPFGPGTRKMKLPTHKRRAQFKVST